MTRLVRVGCVGRRATDAAVATGYWIAVAVWPSACSGLEAGLGSVAMSPPDHGATSPGAPAPGDTGAWSGTWSSGTPASDAATMDSPGDSGATVAGPPGPGVDSVDSAAGEAYGVAELQLPDYEVVGYIAWDKYLFPGRVSSSDFDGNDRLEFLASGGTLLAVDVAADGKPQEVVQEWTLSDGGLIEAGLAFDLDADGADEVVAGMPFLDGLGAIAMDTWSPADAPLLTWFQDRDPLRMVVAMGETQLGSVLVGGFDLDQNDVLDLATTTSGSPDPVLNGNLYIFAFDAWPVGTIMCSDAYAHVQDLYVGNEQPVLTDLTGDGVTDVQVGDGLGADGWMRSFVGPVPSGTLSAVDDTSISHAYRGWWGVGSGQSAGADLNGDGVSDGLHGMLIVNAFLAGTVGGAWLIPGPIPLVPSQSLSDVGWFLDGDGEPMSGHNLLVEDIDGDAALDVLIGFETGYGYPGGMFLVYGPILGSLRLIDESDLIIRGAVSGEGLSSGIATLGDIDDDERGDFAAGAVSHSEPGCDRCGAVYVFQASDLPGL